MTDREKMVRHSLILATVFALIATLGSAKAEPVTPEAARTAIEKATDEVKAGNPAGAIAMVEPVIATLEEMQKDQMVNCAEDMTGVIMLSALQAAIMAKLPEKERRNAIVAVPDFCTALFLKGFALIDLMRMDEAEVFLRRAHEAAPLSAQYLNEYAQWHGSMKQWQKAHDLFEEAFGLGEMDTDKDRKNFNQARALRGMAFSEIEMGELNKAEKNLKKSLRLIPDHAGAKSELQFIADLRQKQKN